MIRATVTSRLEDGRVRVWTLEDEERSEAETPRPPTETDEQPWREPDEHD